MMGRILKVGDMVRTPDNHIGPIDMIDKTPWRDRGERLQKLYRYHVPSPEPGTPIEWWLARQLRVVK